MLAKGGRQSAARWLWFGVALAAAAIARADPVDDYIASKMSTQHIPGLSIAILKAGKPLKVKGYGFANLELRIPATPETVYKIGSVSKQFIASGIVLLAADRKLSLDDPIRKYIEDVPATWQPITIRNALTHTAGWVREPPGYDPLKVQTDIETIRMAYATPLTYKPGEKHSYSNLGYFVLAEIITRAARKPWPQYIQERIFAPLGMSATRTTTIEDLVPNRASGYDYDRPTNSYRNSEIMLGVRPSGAFISSVLDLAKWDAALYTNKPLSAQQRELMWAPAKLNDGTSVGYGFGWAMEMVGKRRHIQHAGGMLGFRSQISRFVDEQLTVIVLTNSGQAIPELMSLRLASFYIADLMPNRKALKLTAAALDALNGTYEAKGSRTRKVARSGDKLALVIVAEGGSTFEAGDLTPESETRFFIEDDTRYTYTFVRAKDGKMRLVAEGEEGKELQRWTRQN